MAAAWVARNGRDLAEPLVTRRPRGRAAWSVPPRRLRARTGAPGAREFVEGGRLAGDELAAALGPWLALADIGELLDFGCGSGRVLPHIAALAPGARCSGCDVDAAAITWAARHLPHLRWAVSDFAPPLPFEPSGFDLIYSISVFSHLDAPLQDRWLAELHRALAPGGVALLSVHGAHAFEQFRSGAARTGWCSRDGFARGPLERDEFIFVPYVRSIWNRAEMPGIGADYGLAFHGEGYLRSHWDGFFEVLDVRQRAISAWQDLVVCRRPID